MNKWRSLLTEDLSKADVVIIGNPYDGATSCGKGAKEVPKKIRELSCYLPPVDYQGEEVQTKVFDMGDISNYLAHQETKEYLKALESNKFVLQIGGDHSISIASTISFFNYHHHKKVGLIHFDAHADLCDIYDNNKYSHACVNRRITEAGLQQDDIAYVGLRSWEVEEKAYIEKNVKNYYPMYVVNKVGLDYVIKELINKFKDYSAIYLSFDIDIVDPAYAPGTGTPEAGGLSSLEALKLIRSLVIALNVKAMDIVEVAPPLDNNDITSWLALKIIYEVFSIVGKKASVK